MTEVISSNDLKNYITRIETLENQKTEISEDIKEVFAEAKSHGFDVQIMKQVLKLKKMDENKLAEQEEILKLYRDALDV